MNSIKVLTEAQKYLKVVMRGSWTEGESSGRVRKFVQRTRYLGVCEAIDKAETYIQGSASDVNSIKVLTDFQRIYKDRPSGLFGGGIIPQKKTCSFDRSRSTLRSSFSRAKTRPQNMGDKKDD
jgi:hypothetical protein